MIARKILFIVFISFFSITSLANNTATIMAQRETQLWQAYYNGNHAQVFLNLSQLLSQEFNLSNPITITYIASQLGLAAENFRKFPKGSHTKTTLPYLIKAYSKLKSAIDAKWDPNKVARMELAWWIAKRGYRQANPENVGKLISKLYITLFGSSGKTYFERAGYLRALAGRYRDLANYRWGGVRPQDWQVIQSLLNQSYHQLLLGRETN